MRKLVELRPTASCALSLVMNREWMREQCRSLRRERGSW